MKKVFIVMLMALMSLGAQAQSEKYAYCVMQCFGKVFSTKYVVTLDFGEVASKRKQIYEDGKKKQFNSNGESLNYMGRRGWELISTYTDRDFKQQMIIYFVFKKKINSEDEVFQGLELKDSEEKD
jgi:hypothetical protein